MSAVKEVYESHEDQFSNQIFRQFFSYWFSSHHILFSNDQTLLPRTTYLENSITIYYTKCVFTENP